jgi:ABC-2 type transport system permease protein
MTQYLRGIYGQVRAYQKRFLRDKVALFFTFLFPLIFLFVFGTIFGSNNTVSLKVAVIDHAQTDFSKQFVDGLKRGGDDAPLKVQGNITNMDDAKKKMSRSEIDGIIELPTNFGAISEQHVPTGTATVLHQKGSTQAGQTIAAILGQVMSEMNKQLGQPEAPMKVATEAVGVKGLTNFDYTFSGLLAFSIMSMGIFGLANAMPSEKQKGSYRRLRASPFTSGQLIIANAIHYTIITLCSVAAMMAVGIGVFHFNMRGDWLVFIVFTILSTVMVTGFGLLIGAWAKNENQSAPLSNLLSFPMMFLSGAFFPSFMFPQWLQAITAFVPLTPVVDGFRMIMTEHASLVTLAPQLGMITLWFVVVYTAAIWLFRWE